ncbi:MAG: ATP-dependent protease subunit HslV [Longimicrobiales bacterium]
MQSHASLTPNAPVRATTVVAVRRGADVALAGDGQVTMGETVVKGRAQKVRRIKGGQVLAGFAGAVADAFALFEKLEAKLERWPSNLPRACTELAKEWRTDRYLRRLEALLLVADQDHLFLVSGDGNVIEPDEPVLAIGSGGNFALSAARALYAHTDLSAPDVARKSLEIAADICIYTNREITVIDLDAK